MKRFALTIFLGAFLLFQVQPILGKYIVPWFGGSMSVWTTCMLFFQLMLLGGYVYAHVLSTRLARGRQIAVHLTLVGGSLLMLPISPSGEFWRADATEAPTAAILMLLLAQIGLPYLILSSTGPLLQSWFKQAHPERSPYRLYALSNAGSLLALISYPFLVESHLTLQTQGWVWAACYLAFAVACGAAGWRTSRSNSTPAAVEERPAAPPQPTQLALWTALAAVGSILLLSTTSKLCEDVATTPLLWVLPLAIYLTTFVICFDHDRWYDRRIFGPVLGLAVAVQVVVHRAFHPFPVATQAALFGATLFVSCMVCHGELVRSRPAARHLTTFYLTIALGGALGGVFTALVAPLLFVDFWEYQIGLIGVATLLLACLYRERDPEQAQRRWVWGSSYVALVGLGIALAWHVVGQRDAFVENSRNFYGVLRVQLVRDEWGNPMAELVHGQTTHGTQFYEPDRKHWPTTYYGHEGGIGVTVAALRELKATSEAPGLRIGVIGLGVGTMAALSEPGDYLRFYEINPEVERLARTHFSFLADAQAEIDVVIGDARITMQRELERGEEQAFDLLVVDAFNSDSIPLHLLTAEALAMYEQHLVAETGVLGVPYLQPAPGSGSRLARSRARERQRTPPPVLSSREGARGDL